jgi:DNA polymerase II
VRLIDIFVNDGKIWCWLFDGHNHFFELKFSPRIYVYASRCSLENLKNVLLQKNISCSLVDKKTLKGVKLVLEIKSTVDIVRKLSRWIDKFTDYSCEIFNSDIPLPEYYMFEHNLFPGCNVEFKLENDIITQMSTNDRPEDTYEIPCLSGVKISLASSGSKLILNDIPLTVSDFVSEFNSLDPDMIRTGNGSVEISMILDLIRKKFPKFSFSRFGTDSFESKGNSYFSYGKMIFTYGGIYLKGRLHMQRRGVLYGKWSLSYPFELARFCVTPLQKINHRSAGYGVTNLQLNHAVSKGFLIPHRYSCVERWKSGAQLFEADRGSMVYEPVIGFHNNVAEIDFTSLYPNIMVKKNISTETLFCKCCPNNLVPGLDINICKNFEGIIPSSLDTVIKQRLKYKNSNIPALVERADAIKGLLVTSFGYMGFRKSKFARIESHQAIQAYSREILIEATKIAESRGFKVVHGIVDSLWIKKRGINNKQCDDLIEDIKQQTGFEIKSEGIYRWIVFLSSTQDHNVPVPTRYYGVFDNGKIKCRGIGLRRHDTPEILKQLEAKIISNLAHSRSEKEFRQSMIDSMIHVKDTINEIIQGCNEDLLVFQKSVSKSDYKGFSPQAIITSKLKQKPSPGQSISYVIADRKAKSPNLRYRLANGKGYDRLEYALLARRAAENLFSPFLDVSVEERQSTIHGSLREKQGILANDLPIRIVET